MQKTGTKLRTYALIALLASVGAASCRSRAIPCPSFSSVQPVGSHSLDHQKVVEYEREGPVRK